MRALVFFLAATALPTSVLAQGTGAAPKAAAAPVSVPLALPGSTPGSRVDESTLAPPAGTGFTLPAALRAMRAKHPLLQGAELAVRAARADQKQARLWTNPTLGASYTKGVVRSSYDDAGYITYGVTQQLELSRAPAARGRVAGLLALAATFDRASLDVSMSLDLESALIDAVAIARMLELYERTLSLLSEAAHVVDQRVAAGAAPRYDATRIGVTTAMAQADRESARADYARALAALRASIGPGVASLSGEPSFALDSETPLRPPEQLLEQALARRPDLEAARQRAASASANITAARRSVWTGVGLDVEGGFGAAPGQQDVGVGLSVPLPALNYGQGLISGAAARAQQAGTLVDAVRITAQLRIDGLYAAVLARRTALADYQTRAVASGDEMLGEAQAGYLAGRFSVLELADAYGAWRDARKRAIELAAAARQAEVELSREVGTPLREALR